jgi:uncharacterized phage protein (TIGR02220 family)
MNTDIRLLVSFKGHRKRLRLRKMLGDRYLDYLIDLWLTVAQDRPEGVLHGWDDLDIAIASGYEGNAAALRDALLSCGFLEADANGYKIHDWDQHQGWCSGARKRSEAARKASQKRWQNRLNNKKLCGRNASAMRSDRNRNPPSPNPNPNPYPNPNITNAPENVSEIVEYLNKKAGARFNSGQYLTQTIILERLMEGFAVADFKAVIDIKAEQWLNDKKMSGNLRPATLFAADKFEGYLQEAKRNGSGEKIQTAKSILKFDGEEICRKYCAENGIEFGEVA